MAKTRRHGRSWVLLVWALLAAATHSGAIALTIALQPEPLPRLFVHVGGKGEGMVISSPEGMSCTGNCAKSFAPGTEITLIATLGEGSTFEGWEGCEMRPERVFECVLTLREDTHVNVSFGLIPERVDVAMLPIDSAQPANDPAAITVTLPKLEEDEIVAEELIEPAEVKPEPEKPEEVAPPPEPEPVPEQPKVAVTPPPQPPPNMRSVEVPDQNEVAEAPDDATHLSDKNRDVAEETRATETNLDREQAGEAVASAESNLTTEEIGAQEEEIAQLEEAEPTTLEEVTEPEDIPESGDSQKIAGAMTGEEGQAGERGELGNDRPAKEPGLLSMRDIGGRGSLMSEQPTGDGGKQGKRGREGAPGIRNPLSFEDYERIVGKDKVEEELALGRKKRQSTKRGRFERKMEVVKSALENFTPEIKPGNQTALKTRAAPFAVYIARMHRTIHELWAFGFLEDLNDKSSTHPLNNWELYTTLEIIINPDGEVHKVNIFHHSGLLEFDVAAIDVVLSGGPYGPPPEEIRSPDGRVYIHWGFYRNFRQCGTFNAQPFILSEAPSGSKNAMDDSALVRSVPKLRKAAESERAAGAGEAAQSSEEQALSGLPSADSRDANHVANLWLSAFAHGSIDKMLAVTGAPFRSGDLVVAESVPEVAKVYRTIISELGSSVRGYKLLSPAEFRQRLGDLPSGIDTTKHLLMVVSLRKSQIVLVLERQKSEYRVVALHPR